MLLYYLRLGGRHLRRYWVSSLLSIGGLTLALSLCLIVMIRYLDLGRTGSEIPNGQRLYTMSTVALQQSGRQLRFMGLKSEVRDTIAKFPGVEAVARVKSFSSGTLVKGDDNYTERVLTGDTTLADLMPHKMAAGTWASAFSDPSQIILSYDMAVKIFETPAAALGQSIDIVQNGVRQTKTISGVVEKYRDYERFKPGAFMGFLASELEQTDKVGATSETFILFEEGIDPDQLFKDYDEQLQSLNDGRQFQKTELSVDRLGVRPFLNVFGTMNASTPSMQILAIAAFMLLLVGVVSHLSLASAIAAARGREIALRKVAGASRSQLVGQFLAESLVLVTVAFILAILLANDISAALEPVIGADLTVIASYRWKEIMLLAVISGIVGLLGGVQPGLAAFKSSVSGTLATLGRATVGGGATLRRVFLLIQACLAGGMIFASIIMYQQVNLLLEADRGYDARHVHSVALPVAAPSSKSSVLLNKIQSFPGVLAAGLSDLPPYGRAFASIRMLTMPEGKPEMFGTAVLSPEVMEMSGVSLVAGRPPTKFKSAKAEGADGQAVQQVMLLNRDLGKFGVPADPQDAVGTCMYVKSNPLPDAKTTCYEIVGVLPDMRYTSMRGDRASFLSTLYFAANPEEGAPVRYIWLELLDESLIETQAAIRSAFTEIYPDALFEITRGEDQLSNISKQESALLIMIQLSALGTLVIALSGIYSLTRFDVTRQGREIALRRVLGAGDRSVIGVIVRKMLPYVVVGLALGLAIAWLVVGVWLEQYAVRVDLSLQQVGIVFLAGMGLYVLSALTELTRAIRIRPADVLHAD